MPDGTPGSISDTVGEIMASGEYTPGRRGQGDDGDTNTKWLVFTNTAWGRVAGGDLTLGLPQNRLDRQPASMGVARPW